LAIHSTQLEDPQTRARSRHHAILRLIAFFKFLKAASLIAIGVGLLKLVHRDVEPILEHWVAIFGFDPDSRLVSRLIAKATSLPPARIKELGIVSFSYAALFLTEGTGLWLLKRWAEWFTVIITGSLVPLELYEIFRRPSVVKSSRHW
jgi:uncharacterized membrane protein (DUF2068 family)